MSKSKQKFSKYKFDDLFNCALSVSQKKNIEFCETVEILNSMGYYGLIELFRSGEKPPVLKNKKPKYIKFSDNNGNLSKNKIKIFENVVSVKNRKIIIDNMLFDQLKITATNFNIRNVNAKNDKDFVLSISKIIPHKKKQKLKSSLIENIPSKIFMKFVKRFSDVDKIKIYSNVDSIVDMYNSRSYHFRKTDMSETQSISNDTYFVVFQGFKILTDKNTTEKTKTTYNLFFEILDFENTTKEKIISNFNMFQYYGISKKTIIKIFISFGYDFMGSVDVFLNMYNLLFQKTQCDEIFNFDKNITYPDFVFQKFIRRYGNFIVINDNVKFDFGAKQRASINFVKKMTLDSNGGYDHFIYCGPVNAMGAFALGIACIENKVKCTLFLQGMEMSKQAKKLLTIPNSKKYVKINLYRKSLKDVENICDNFVNKSQDKILKVPFGVDNNDYVSELERSLVKDKHLQAIKFFEKPPKTLWIAGGSGVLMRVFANLLKDTFINVVQVGKSVIVPENLKDRIKLWWSPQKFNEIPKILPPYKSIKNYDAKVWQFVLQHGVPGDYIWNVS